MDAAQEFQGRGEGMEMAKNQPHCSDLALGVPGVGMWPWLPHAFPSSGLSSEVQVHIGPAQPCCPHFLDSEYLVGPDWLQMAVGWVWAADPP